MAAHPYRVNADEALAYPGYAGQALDPDLQGRMAHAFAAVEEQSDPQFAYRVYPVEAAPDGVALLGSGLVLPGASIAAHLDGAHAAALLCATLGLENERAARRASVAGTLSAALFSAGGSSLVEDVANAAEAAIAAEAAAQGLHTGSRFSPGYGDLPLSLQPAILAALGADKHLGVTANAAFLMTPAKSVTAVVGLFADGAPQAKSTCVACACAPHCTLRKVRPCYR